MILILSEERDITTDIVCNWLKFMQTEFIRINNEKTGNVSVILNMDDSGIQIILQNNETQIGRAHV